MGRLKKRPGRLQVQLYNTYGLSDDTKTALRFLILAAVFGNAFTIATTSAAWTGYLRLLGANAMQLGIFSAIPVAMSVVQILASYLIESRLDRRMMTVMFGFVQRIGWIVIGLVPVLFPQMRGDVQLYLIMAVLAMASCGASVLTIGFYSLAGDVVPPRIRGSYFSARQMLFTMSGIVAGLTVGLAVDRARSINGYVAVICCAGVVGLLDICCYLFIKWPQQQRRKREKGDTGFFGMLWAVLRDRGYMRIVAYFTLWFFAVNLITPFVNVFLLEEIRLSYVEIAIYNQIVPNLATLFIVTWWGRQMDRFGNQPVVQTVGLYCMLIPATFIFLGPGSFWLLPIANVFNGMCFPASDIGQQNMYMAKAPVKNRSMYVAVFLTSTQLLGTALSSFVAGMLMEGPFVRMEVLNLSIGAYAVNRYDYLFLLSTLLRSVCVLAILPHLREEWETPAQQMVRTLAREARENSIRRRIGRKAARIRRQYRRKHPIE